MNSLNQTEHVLAPGAPGVGAASRPQYHRVVIAVDESFVSQKAIPHGIAVADALGADIVFLRVLEPTQRNGSLTDPVDWHLLREQARRHIEGLAARMGGEGHCIETHIEEGRPSEQICRWAHENQAGVTVLSTQGIGGTQGTALGPTARHIIESAPGSVLLVPAAAESNGTVCYRRIIVPLDGSSRAESAVPVAERLAEAMSAEIVLLHAVPEPELTEIGPLEPEGLELRTRLLRRNERVAQMYLGRVRSRLAAKNLSVRIVLLRSGDSRHLLVHAITDQKADLVVMALHGHGGHQDVPAGSVASHLIAQATVPVLLVRTNAPYERVGGTPIGNAFSTSVGRPAGIAA